MIGTEKLKEQQERNGKDFDAAMLALARRETRNAIHAIAAGISPGMIEEDAVSMARRLLKEAGMVRGWHGIHVRFGPNTLKNFGEPSTPHTVLGEHDIFFIDIGPVWRGYEGDGGETFTVGNDAEMMRAASDVRAIFDGTQQAWRDGGLTGVELYAVAVEQARLRGWQLNLEMSGHRLSDFPHAIKFNGPLADAPYPVSPDLWVLEIQIRHPDLPFGAFYEDLMTRA